MHLCRLTQCTRVEWWWAPGVISTRSRRNRRARGGRRELSLRRHGLEEHPRAEFRGRRRRRWASWTACCTSATWRTTWVDNESRRGDLFNEHAAAAGGHDALYVRARESRAGVQLFVLPALCGDAGGWAGDGEGQFYSYNVGSGATSS